MAQSRITEHEVFEAARKLAEAGESPSAIKIREALGNRGGMGTIQKHLDFWREENDTTVVDTFPMPETLEGDSLTLIRQIWNGARAEVENSLALEREALEQEREKINSHLRETIAVSESQEQQIIALTESNEKMNVAVEKAESRLHNESKISQKLTIDVAVLEERISNLRDQFEQMEAQLESSYQRENELIAKLDKFSPSKK